MAARASSSGVLNRTRRELTSAGMTERGESGGESRSPLPSCSAGQITRSIDRRCTTPSAPPEPAAFASVPSRTDASSELERSATASMQRTRGAAQPAPEEPGLFRFARLLIGLLGHGLTTVAVAWNVAERLTLWTVGAFWGTAQARAGRLAGVWAHGGSARPRTKAA